jgi:uncharacterized protein (DUF849 family)
MSQRVIVTCALTGSAPDTFKRNPAVPVTPEAIASSAIDAARAGAAIVHIHVRNPETGAPSRELAHYREVVERIRASDIDVIINLTTGPGARFVPGDEDPFKVGPGTTLAGPEDRISHILELKPEICSLDIATMNMGDAVFMNTPPHLRVMADAIRKAGVKPELEVFDLGHIRLARVLIDEGLIEAPPLFQVCTGVPWGMPAEPRSLMHATDLLPEGAVWAAFGISRNQFPIAAQTVLLGGHVRVGLEDNLWLERGVLAPSNAALVEKAVSIIRILGAEPATPVEARSVLKLRGAG